MATLLNFAYLNGLRGLYDYIFIAGFAGTVGGLLTVYQQVSVRGGFRHKLATGFFCALEGVALLSWLVIMTATNLGTVAKVGWSIGLLASVVVLGWGLAILKNEDESSAHYRRIAKGSTGFIVSVVALIGLFCAVLVVYSALSQ